MFKRKKRSQKDFDNDDDMFEENESFLDDDSFDDEKYDDYDEDGDEEDFFEDEDSKEKSNQLAEKKKEYYVKAEDLINEIRKYQESKKDSPDGKGKISEELGLMIMKICTRFSMHPRFYRI